MWMTPGSTFTGRAGTSITAVQQDIAPENVGLAFYNGWTPLPQNQWPALLNVPEFGVSQQAGALYSLKLFQTGVPMIVAPTGSMANNGVNTIGTAGPTGFWNGPCYLNLPASAIVAGSAAGNYYTLLSSTTAGTTYNNTYTSGLPVVPGAAALSPVVGTGPGAYTGVTTAQTVLSFPLPGNLMGPNGIVEFSFLIGFHASTNNKTVTIKVGTNTIFSLVEATTGITTYQGYVLWGNQGATGAQFAQSGGLTGASSNPQTFTTVDTTSTQTITVNVTNAVATDWTSIDSFSAVVTPG